MGQSVETRVRVVSLTRRNHGTPELVYVQHEQYPDHLSDSYLTPKAYKALKGAQPGDFVDVVWDYDIEGGKYGAYPIVKAKRITGTLESRVEALEAALRAAGIPIPEERT